MIEEKLEQRDKEIWQELNRCQWARDEWEPSSDESIRKEAVDYMEFAWDKANNFRGLSAGRSMDHFTSWLWLLGDNEIWSSLQQYEYYGKDNLRRICEFLGLDADQWDDGVRLNSEPY